MTPFGYTMLGFGGGKNQVPIAEDLTYSEVTDIADIQDDLWLDLDPWNKNRVLLAFRDDGTYGNDTQIVCGNLAADGNSVTWGTVVEYDPEYGDIGSVTWDSNVENSFCILGKSRNSGVHFPIALAGTVSGTTITLGSQVNISFRTADDYMNNMMGIFNPAQAGQVIQVDGNYDGSVSRAGEIKVITVSGTTVTHVSSADFEAGEVGNADIHWDKVTANKGYISFSGISMYPCVRPFTMSGNTVTLGTKHIINSHTSGEYQAMCTMETGGRLVSMYKDANDMQIRVGNDDSTGASGTITWGTEVTLADYTDEGSHLILYPTIMSEVNTPNKVLAGYNIPVSGSSSRWAVGTITGDDTITMGSYVHAFASSATPDINKNIIATPTTWATPGLIYTTHSHTGDGSKPKIVGHQLASFEL